MNWMLLCRMQLSSMADAREKRDKQSQCNETLSRDGTSLRHTTTSPITSHASATAARPMPIPPS